MPCVVYGGATGGGLRTGRMSRQGRLQARQAHSHLLHHVKRVVAGQEHVEEQTWTGRHLIGCRGQSTGYVTIQPAARPCASSPLAALPACSLASRQTMSRPGASGWGVAANATESAARDCGAVAAAAARAEMAAEAAMGAGEQRAATIGPVAPSAAPPDASTATTSSVVVPAFARGAGIVAVPAAALKDGSVAVMGAVVRMVGTVAIRPVLTPRTRMSRRSRPRAFHPLSR